MNVGQLLIFNTGMMINLALAARDVSLGLMTAGDFILIQTYFMQLSGPLFNMGMMFREVGQTQVDVEDLVNMLERVPKIQDSPNAVDFNFRAGEIELKGVTYGHSKDEKSKSNNNNSDD